MKAYIRALSLLVLLSQGSLFINAQSIDLELISNVGDAFENPAIGDLDATIGEIITGTYDECVLTNGFMQTYETVDCGFETTSIKTITSQDFELFPNPTFGELNLSTPESYDFELRIISSNGQVKLQQKFNETNQIKIDVTTLQDGVFFLELISEKIIYNKSFIKITDQ